ncbi:MAG: hypothetical protein FWD15_03825 [Alphaproteobacteria bacterium]|nr:hypothetical protein [Alphaproteobacteria bacterium]
MKTFFNWIRKATSAGRGADVERLFEDTKPVEWPRSNVGDRRNHTPGYDRGRRKKKSHCKGKSR